MRVLEEYKRSVNRHCSVAFVFVVVHMRMVMMIRRSMIYDKEEGIRMKRERRRKSTLARPGRRKVARRDAIMSDGM